MWRALWIATVLAVSAAGLSPVALAQPSGARGPGEGPVLFKADELRYDRELGVMVATGHVEFSRDANILRADTVTYNEREDTATASGHVVLLAATGEVYFADYMALSGDLKNGVIRNLRARLTDNSRLAANGARRVGGVRNEMAKAVYTACAACAEDPERAPLWQIRADRVVHDEKSHEIKYYDATMEMFGVPVAYLPYFQHPDPTVDRKTGFLVPTFGSDSELGRILRVPYFINLAPNRDVTLDPILTTEEGPVLAGEYRERFAHGKLGLAGSITKGSSPDGTDDIRGHVKADTEFDLGPNWRTGANIYRTTDDTYLARYRFDSKSLLTSRAYLEGFHGRNYSALEGFAFQGLRSDDIGGQTPLVAPLANYSFVGEPGTLGGRWEVNAQALQITRSDGTDTRHLSVTPGWRLPKVADTGEVYTLFATLQTDLYQFDDHAVPDQPPGVTSSGTSGRVFPQIGADWRYPLIRQGRTVSEVLEPIVGIVAAPNGGNPSDIPNEDSRDFELQDTNIFAANRFAGLDRVEGGQRVYYGLRATVEGGEGSGSALIGQSYRFRRDSTFQRGSGLSDHFSDIVGRVSVQPSSLLNLIYRFRLDHDGFGMRRQELSGIIGPPAVRLSVDYLSIDAVPSQPELVAREEVRASIAAQLTPRWRFTASMVRNLADPGGQLSQGFSLAYEDECFAITTNYVRSFSYDRDLRPSTTVFFRVVFKNLGEVQL